MIFDWTIKITDIIMIFAIIVGPIIAVQITEFIRRHQDQRDRKMYLFRTLMATRSATLAPAHIEALNLVEIEFHSNNHQDCKVVNAWKLYRAHLFDSNYPKESWDARRADLLVELLYEMSSELGYNYDKAHIKGGTYYPKNYGDTELDQTEIRKLLLELLRGNRTLPVSVPESIQQEHNITQ